MLAKDQKVVKWKVNVEKVLNVLLILPVWVLPHTDFTKRQAQQKLNGIVVL